MANTQNRFLDNVKIIDGIRTSKNYILNSAAVRNTAGYATYADVAGSQPVDGTGGSPNVTWTRSTTTPLADDASFLFTKDAVNRQGQGVSYDFTVDLADRAKVLNIEFDYTLVSGSYSNGDMGIYIYDITNAQVIQPAGFEILSVVTDLPVRKSQVTFQTASNSSSYRLIFHVASTSASAYTLKFDNIKVSSQVVPSGVPVTDFNTNLTFTPNNFGTVSNSSFRSKRIGDELYVQFYFQAGTTAANPASITLPVTIDTNKISTTTNGNLIGEAFIVPTTNTVVPDLDVAIFFDGSATNTIFFSGSAGATANQFNKTNASSLSTGTYSLTGWFKIPVVGWSSNVVISNTTDTRVVAMRAALTTSTVGISSQVVAFNSATLDTHASLNTSTGRYTVPVPGIYKVTARVVFEALDGATNATIQLRRNTVNYGQAFSANLSASTTVAQAVLADEISCVAGDILDIFASGDASFNIDNNGTRTVFTIERLSGPSQIAASEFVGARYTTAAGQAINNGNTDIINYGTRVYDSHNAVTTGASWRYTVPVSGKYEVSFAAFAQAAAGTFQFNLVRNGSTYSEIYRNLTSNQNMWSGIDTVECVSGDTLDIRLSNGSGGTITLNTNALENRIVIKRIGN